MNVTRRLCLGALLFALSAAAQNEPAHSNFTGRWRMLKEQSDFGKFSRPDIVVRVVDQRGNTLNLHTVETTSGKTSVADLSYFTDGTPASNTRGGRAATTKAFWDGDSLMLRTDTTDSKNEDVQIVEHWELSPDHNLLVTTSDITTPAGEAHLKLVCQREAEK